MKKIKILLFISIFLFFAISTHGGIKGNIGKLQKPSSGQSIDTEKTIDVNNIEMFVTNLGSFAWDLTTGNPGLIFPKGTIKTPVFASGIWVGAKVGGATRVTVAEYSQEFVPGIMEDSTNAPDVPRFRVYKINKGDTPASNPDYADWPVADGAPVDSLGNPLVLGDQTLWCVYNDADPSAHTNDAGRTSPLGVEIQQTTFAFNRRGALGNTIFLKFKLINKGRDTLENTYISVWSDPDLGGAADDLVGCDTLLSLGYCYNATNADQLYGTTPPAVGYDFFQGPIVPGNPTDTAWVSGEPRPGFKNLPMTSFNKYINGTDPRNSTQSYQYMMGLDAVAGLGAPYINPITGEVTTFVMSGDPVTGTGWLDANPSDRRFLLTSGPFTMAPADTQEVVTAIIVAQGADRLSSISVLKLYDQKAQAVFDRNFITPGPPPQPTVYYRPFKEAIDLVWGQEALGDVQSFPDTAFPQIYVHEGYNVYQCESQTGGCKKIATFDIANVVDKLYIDDDVSPTEKVRRLFQDGNNTGLQHHLYIDRDHLTGEKLVNGKEYYFAVTSYNYDTLHVEPYTVEGALAGYLTYSEENSLEPKNIILAVPLSQGVVLADTAQHVTGTSDGYVAIEYLDQSKITGHNYRVTFNEDLTWNLTDLSLDTVLLADQTNQTGDYLYPILDGFMPVVWGPLPGIRDWEWTPGGRWLTGVDFGGGFFFGGLDIGYNFFGSLLTNLYTGFPDVEIRFSPTTTQKAYDYLRGGTPNYGYVGYFDCPFTIWDVTSQPERQLNAAFVEQNGQPSYDSTWGPDSINTHREYLFIFNSDYSDTPDPWYTSHRILADADSFDVLYAMWPLIRAGHTIDELADGQIFHIYATKPNAPADTFTFKTYKVGEREGTTVKNTLANIWVVPNPFYNRAYNQGPFEHAVKFMNLPTSRWTIKIFNIAGDLVRTLKQEDPTQSIYEWNLLTEKGLPVASGIYIYYIESEGLGSTFGKMAIFMEEERLRTF